MPITSSGALEFTAGIGREIGLAAGAKFRLKHASEGGYATINTNNSADDRPDGSAPHLASEWYSYDHYAEGLLAIGDYGNDPSDNVTRMFSSSSGSLDTITKTVSNANFCGQSIIGYQGYVYYRMQSINNYRQDAQLFKVDYHGYGYSAVGATSGTYGYANWKTTRLTTNEAYTPLSTFYTVAAGTSAGRWNRDTGNTPSGNTGVDVGSTGCIYYEGSSTNGANKDVYLRSPLITFNTNIIKSKWYHYGSGFAAPAQVWMGIYITAQP